MHDGVQQERVGPVVVLVVDVRIGMVPSALACQALISALDVIDVDPSVAAIVLLGRSEGQPGEEQTSGDPAAMISDLCKRFETMTRPVVLGLDGACLGPGADMALAAHFRLATTEAQVGWPGVALEEVPAGGGTQRLPRLVGPGPAVEILITGRLVDAQQAADIGLIDGVVRGDLVQATVSLARRLAQSEAGPRPTGASLGRLTDSSGYHSMMERLRRQCPFEHCSAAERIVECVEAAMVLPFEVGLAFEAAAADDMARSDRAHAIRHLRAAEAAASALDMTEPPRFKTVGLHACGRDGADLACALLAGGCSVVVSDQTEPGLQAMLSRIGQTLATEGARGSLSAEERATRLSRLRGGTTPASLSGCDLVIAGARDCPVSDIAVARILRALGPEGILGRAGPVPPTQSQVGGADTAGRALHLAFAKAAAGGVVEIIPGSAALAPVAGLMSLFTRLGRQPVTTLTGTGEGVVWSLARRLHDAADQLLEDGATPRQVDLALEDAGFTLGPYRWLDREGLAVFWQERRSAADRRDPRRRYVVIADRLCESGRLGQSVGRGFYDYPDSIPEGVPSAAVEGIVSATRIDAGISARPIANEEIVDRCMLALTLEGLWLQERHAVQRMSDIDVLAVHGLGYPAARGGPMFQASREGWSRILMRLQTLASTEDSVFWAAPPLLGRLAAADDRGAATMVAATGA